MLYISIGNYALLVDEWNMSDMMWQLMYLRQSYLQEPVRRDFLEAIYMKQADRFAISKHCMIQILQ